MLQRIRCIAISSLKYLYILFDRDAALMPVRQRLQGKSITEVRQMDLSSSDLVIHHSDMESALSKVSPSVSDGDLQKFADWMEQYGAR